MAFTFYWNSILIALPLLSLALLTKQVGGEDTDICIYFICSSGTALTFFCLFTVCLHVSSNIHSLAPHTHYSFNFVLAQHPSTTTGEAEHILCIGRSFVNLGWLNKRLLLLIGRNGFEPLSAPSFLQFTCSAKFQTHSYLLRREMPMSDLPSRPTMGELAVGRLLITFSLFSRFRPFCSLADRWSMNKFFMHLLLFIIYLCKIVQ